MFGLKYRFERWKYKNTFLLLASFALLFFLAGTEAADRFILWFETLGYVGIFVTGAFFVSTFTVAPAAVMLFNFAADFNPFFIALAAGSGAVVGDYIIFRFVKDRVWEELHPLFSDWFSRHLKFEQLFATPYFAWFLPVLGAVIIASPLPDEVGVGLLGISRMKHWQFLALSFFLNALGIFAIVVLSLAVG